jgi:hypothetical protein
MYRPAFSDLHSCISFPSPDEVFASEGTQLRRRLDRRMEPLPRAVRVPEEAREGAGAPWAPNRRHHMTAAEIRGQFGRLEECEVIGL